MTLSPLRRPSSSSPTGPSTLADDESTGLRRDLRAARRRDRTGIALQLLITSTLIAAALGTMLYLLTQR